MSNFDSRHSKKTRFLKVFIVRKKIEFGLILTQILQTNPLKKRHLLETNVSFSYYTVNHGIFLFKVTTCIWKRSLPYRFKTPLSQRDKSLRGFFSI